MLVILFYELHPGMLCHFGFGLVLWYVLMKLVIPRVTLVLAEKEDPDRLAMIRRELDPEMMALSGGTYHDDCTTTDDTSHAICSTACHSVHVCLFFRYSEVCNVKYSYLHSAALTLPMCVEFKTKDSC